MKALGAAFTLDSRILAFEYDDAVPVAMQLYEKALRAHVGVPASGGDHTSFDNRAVWANFLDNSFVEKAFPGRVAPFTVLPTLLRVWLSILDGEAQVERDLGFMRGFEKSAKGRCGDKLLEDLLILKIAGPSTSEEVGGQFAYRCAELWRTHHGWADVHRKRRRLSQPAARRQPCHRSSFAEAKRAVLRASVRAKLPRSDSAQTAFGVTADFFKAERGDISNPSQWSEGLQKFHRLSQAYKLKNRLMSKFSRSGFPAFKLRNSTNQRQPPDMSDVRLVTYLPTFDEAACGALAAGYERRSGFHAAKNADIVIVDDLARLHSHCASLEWVVPMTYIVARVLPVTTFASARAVDGDMRRISVTSIREHEPQKGKKVLFLVANALNAECPALAAALRGIEQMPSSAWRVKLTNNISVQPAAPKAAAKRRGRPAAAAKEEVVHVSDLAAMWAWLRSNRITVNARYTRMCWRRGLPSSI